MYESDNKIQIPVTFDTAPIVIRHLEELGFKPQVKLNEGVKRTVLSFD